MPARPLRAAGPHAVPREARARPGPSEPAPPRAPASKARSRASSAPRLRRSGRAAGGVASLVPTPQRTYKGGARAVRPLFLCGAPAVMVHGKAAWDAVCAVAPARREVAGAWLLPCV